MSQTETRDPLEPVVDMTLLSVEELKKRCRLKGCCLDSTSCIDLFIMDSEAHWVPETLQQYFHITISKNDGLSQFICGQCYDELSITTVYIELCQQNQKTMWDIYRNSSSGIGMSVNDVHDKVIIKKEEAMETDESTTENSIPNTVTAIHSPIETPLIKKPGPLSKRKSCPIVPIARSPNPRPCSEVDIIPQKSPSSDKQNEVSSSVSLPSVYIPNILDPNYVESITNSKILSNKYVQHIKDHPKYVPWPNEDNKIGINGKFGKGFKSRRKKSIKVMKKCTVLVQDIFLPCKENSSTAHMRKSEPKLKTKINPISKTNTSNSHDSGKYQHGSSDGKIRTKRPYHRKNKTNSDIYQIKSVGNFGNSIRLKKQKKTISKAIISDESNSESDTEKIGNPSNTTVKVTGRTIFSDSESDREINKFGHSSNEQKKHGMKLKKRMIFSDTDSESDEKSITPNQNTSASIAKCITGNDDDINDIDHVIDTFFPLDNENDNQEGLSKNKSAVEIKVNQSHNTAEIKVTQSHNTAEIKITQENSSTAQIRKPEPKLKTKINPIPNTKTSNSHDSGINQSHKEPKISEERNNISSYLQSLSNDQNVVISSKLKTNDFDKRTESNREHETLKNSNISTQTQLTQSSMPISAVPTTSAATVRTGTIHYDTQNIQKMSTIKRNSTIPTTNNNNSLTNKTPADILIVPETSAQNNSVSSKHYKSAIQNYCAKQSESHGNRTEQNRGNSSGLKQLFNNDPTKMIPLGKKMSSINTNQAFPFDVNHRSSYKCTNCSVSFDKRRVLENHLKRKHTNSNTPSVTSNSSKKIHHVGRPSSTKNKLNKNILSAKEQLQRRARTDNLLTSQISNAAGISPIASVSRKEKSPSIFAFNSVGKVVRSPSSSSNELRIAEDPSKDKKRTDESRNNILQPSSLFKNTKENLSLDSSDNDNTNDDLYDTISSDEDFMSGVSKKSRCSEPNDTSGVGQKSGDNTNILTDKQSDKDILSNRTSVNKLLDPDKHSELEKLPNDKPLHPDEKNKANKNKHRKNSEKGDSVLKKPRFEPIETNKASKDTEREIICKTSSTFDISISKDILINDPSISKPVENVSKPTQSNEDNKQDRSSCREEEIHPVKKTIADSIKSSVGGGLREFLVQKDVLPTASKHNISDICNPIIKSLTKDTPLKPDQKNEVVEKKHVENCVKEDKILKKPREKPTETSKASKSTEKEIICKKSSTTDTFISKPTLINDPSISKPVENVSKPTQSNEDNKQDESPCQEEEIHPAKKTTADNIKPSVGGGLRGIRINKDVLPISGISNRDSKVLRELRIEKISNSSNGSKKADNVDIVDLISDNLDEPVGIINEPDQTQTLTLRSEESQIGNHENKTSALSDMPGTNESRLDETSYANESTVTKEKNTDKENEEVSSVKNVVHRRLSGDNNCSDQSNVRAACATTERNKDKDNINAGNVSDLRVNEKLDNNHNDNIAVMKKRRNKSDVDVDNLKVSKRSKKKQRKTQGKMESQSSNIFNRQKGLIVNFAKSKFIPKKKKKKTLGTRAVTDSVQTLQDKIALMKADYETNLNTSEPYRVPEIENQDYLECTEGKTINTNTKIVTVVDDNTNETNSCSSDLEKTITNETILNSKIKSPIDDGICMDREILKNNNIIMIDDDNELQDEHEIVTPVITNSEIENDFAPVISTLGYDNGDDIVEIENQTANIGNTIEKKNTLFPLTPEEINAKLASNKFVVPAINSNRIDEHNEEFANDDFLNEILTNTDERLLEPDVPVSVVGDQSGQYIQGKTSESNENDSTILPSNNTGQLMNNVDLFQSLISPTTYTHSNVSANSQFSINDHHEPPSVSANPAAQLHTNQNPEFNRNSISPNSIEKLNLLEKSGLRCQVIPNEDPIGTMTYNIYPKKSVEVHQNQTEHNSLHSLALNKLNTNQFFNQQYSYTTQSSSNQAMQSQTIQPILEVMPNERLHYSLINMNMEKVRRRENMLDTFEKLDEAEKDLKRVNSLKYRKNVSEEIRFQRMQDRHTLENRVFKLRTAYEKARADLKKYENDVNRMHNNILHRSNQPHNTRGMNDCPPQQPVLHPNRTMAYHSTGSFQQQQPTSQHTAQNPPRLNNGHFL